MEQSSDIFVGLDVAKLKISVAVAEGGRGGEVRFFGDVGSTSAAVAGLIKKLSRNGARLRFCYEAGPTGYGLQRQILAAGHDCAVVAPSLITAACRRAGEDQPARRGEPGQTAQSGRVDGGVGSGLHSRSDARLGAGAGGGDGGATAGAPASAASRTDL